MFEHWVESDLGRLPTVNRLAGRVFTHDSLANKIGVRVTKGGEPVELSGTVKAFVKKPNGDTIEVTGTASGNEAYVILPSAAYTSTGMLGIYIRLVNEDSTVTLGGVEGLCYRSRTGTIIGAT